MTKNLTKSWYESKTLQGAFVSIIGLVVVALNLPVTEVDITEILGQLVALVGTIYAIYGRIVTDGTKLTK